MKGFVCKVHGPQTDPYAIRQLYRGKYRTLRGCKLCRSSRGKAYAKLHKVAASRYHAEWYKRNRSKRLSQSLERRQRIKAAVIAGYGGRCTCCGELHQEFLTVDHINGGGHRLRQKGAAHCGPKFYAMLVRESFPDTYRLLCMNCNFASGMFGACPHGRERAVTATES